MHAESKTTYTLEMQRPEDLRPKHPDTPGLQIERVAVKCPEYNKFLHTVVGHQWRWGGRSHWTKDDWYTFVNRDELETWVATFAGTPAGYFELEKHTEGDVEILTLGLLPQFIGQGLGGSLLTVAVQRAWQMGANKVWLRTCSHDHPNALRNYLARGLVIRQTKKGPVNRPFKSFWESMIPDC
ncbi:MAG: GNAT family N-acetyltransferase [Chloroflexota bacterium]|nr:GNAT family N-acetyltransferase [Chloroflexota bacterium]